MKYLNGFIGYMLKYLLLGVSIEMLLYGILVRKENLEVLRKAVTICLQCIGVG